MKLLSRNAKIYVVCMIAAAPLLSLLLVPGMRLQRPVEFALLTLLAGLTATLKVTLPATMGTMSVAYTVVIATILLLGPAEAMIVGAFSAASQCLWRVKEKAPLHRTLFSISTVALTAGISGLVFEASLKILGSRDMQAIATSLLIATSVYFLLNSVTISMAIGLSAKKPLWETWHQNFLWTAPGFYFGSLLALIMSEFVRRTGLSVFLLTIPPVYIIYHSYRIYMARVEDGYRHLKEMEKLHLSTIEALALAIDAKDQVTHGHLQRVQVYAEGLAKALGLDEKEIQATRAGALLHDIGKLAIPDYILNKPGKLTRKEFQKMSIHPLVGSEILSAVDFPYPVADLVLNHHERWDGAGYPKGLKKEEIPIGARILSVVDCFDALSSDRPYRKALSLEKALEYVVSERGRSFDPRVVDTLVALHGTLAPQAYKAAAKARNLSLRETVDELSAALDVRAPHFLSPFENISAAHQELSALYELVEVIGTSLNLNETLQLITEKIKKLIPNSLCGFYFLEDERIVPKYLEGVNETLFEKVAFPLEGSVFGWALRNRHPILNANLYEMLKPVESLRQGTSLKSALVAPLFINNQPMGLVCLYDEEPNKFTEDHLRILEMVSTKAAIAIKNATLFEQTHENSLTDPLTGLPNSRYMFLQLDQEIARARRDGYPLAVLAMDLDNFKLINDQYGHPTGDRVLTEVSRILKGKMREYDFIARLGGDEFVALLPKMGREDVHKKIDVIRKEVGSYALEGHGELIQLGISLGWAVFEEDGKTTETLLSIADTRMYEDKYARKRAMAARMTNPPNPLFLTH